MEELIDKYETLMIKNPSQIRWVLTELIKEAQAKKLTLGDVVKSLPDGDDLWCRANEMSRDNFADWHDNL